MRLVPGIAARTGGEDVVVLGVFRRRRVDMVDVMPLEPDGMGYRGNKRRVMQLAFDSCMFENL